MKKKTFVLTMFWIIKNVLEIVTIVYLIYSNCVDTVFFKVIFVFF